MKLLNPAIIKCQIDQIFFRSFNHGIAPNFLLYILKLRRRKSLYRNNHHSFLLHQIRKFLYNFLFSRRYLSFYFFHFNNSYLTGFFASAFCSTFRLLRILIGALIVNFTNASLILSFFRGSLSSSAFKTNSIFSASFTSLMSSFPTGSFIAISLFLTRTTWFIFSTIAPIELSSAF